MTRISAGRDYGGMTAAERAADRRAKLLAAGRRLWAENGWEGVKVRAVTAEAGLIDRYFYESFSDRDALLDAIIGELNDEYLRLISGALLTMGEPPIVRLRVAIETVVGVLVANPDVARIMLADHHGHPRLEQRRMDLVLTVADAITDIANEYLTPEVEAGEFRMVVLLGVSGFYDVIRAWHAGKIADTPEQIIERAVRFATHMTSAYAPGALAGAKGVTKR